MSENINFDYITDYLRSLIKPREGLLKQIEEKAHKEESYVPIAEPETVTFLKFLTAATGEMSENPLFITSVLPLGDGVAVSYKK